MGLFATTPVLYPYHHTSARKPRAFSPGRAEHVLSSCHESSMTTQGDNETAINGRINTDQQAVRLAEAPDSCRAMGLTNPGSPQTHGSLQSKRHDALGPGIGPIMDWTKPGFPQSMFPPNPSSPRAGSEQAMAPQEARSPAGSGQQDGGREIAAGCGHVDGPLIAFLRCSGVAFSPRRRRAGQPLQG